MFTSRARVLLVASLFVTACLVGVPALVSISGGVQGNEHVAGFDMGGQNEFFVWSTRTSNWDPPTIMQSVWFKRNGDSRATLITRRHDMPSLPDPTGSSEKPTIDDSGEVIAFESTARKLSADQFDANGVPIDGFGTRDVFVYRASAGGQSEIRWVSQRYDGGPANAESAIAAVTGNGDYVFFTSSATDLIQGDNPGLLTHVYRYRVADGEIERVSRAFDGGLPNQSVLLCANIVCSHRPVSDDGSRVVVTSKATNLVDKPDLNDGHISHRTDIFVIEIDPQGGTTNYRVSENQSGSNTNRGDTLVRAVLSGDGNFVAFESEAGLLEPDRTEEVLAIYVRAVEEPNTLEWIDRPLNSVTPLQGSSIYSMDRQGRYILIGNHGMNSQGQSLILGGDNDTFGDVYRFDRETRVFRLVSHGSNGVSDNASSGPAAIGPYGLQVAFKSSATNITNDDNNGKDDLFYLQEADEVE